MVDVPRPADEPVRRLAAWFETLPPGPLSYQQAQQLLEVAGVPFARGGLTHSPAEASALAEKIGYPVAVKVDSPQITHRSDLGAVRVGLRDRQEVEAAFQAVVAAARQARPEADVEGVVVQQMVGRATEVILGVQADPEVGPVVLLGLGGLFVEVLRDVALRPAPLAPHDAEEMLAELRSLPLLLGARGRPPADLEALKQSVLDVGWLAAALGPSLAELDLNPLMILPAGQGVLAVDAVVVRAESQPGDGSIPAAPSGRQDVIERSYRDAGS